MINRVLYEIEEQAELEGHQRDSESFKNRVIGLKVEKCQILKNNPCQLCPYLENCGLAMEFWRIVRDRNNNGK
jgi:hypothetical protein